MREAMPTPVSCDLARRDLSAGGAVPSQADRFSPPVSNLIVRESLENSQAFLNRLLILPIGREQEEEVIGEFKAAGLASDEPAEGCLFLRNPGFIRRVELGKMCVISTHGSHRFVLAE
jgi:hypothetical protein